MMAATDAKGVLEHASAEQARILAALFCGSPVMTRQLAAHPDWMAILEPGRLRFPRRDQGLRTEVNEILTPFLDEGDKAGALDGLRQFKQREMLRIAARDLGRLGDVAEITLEISNVADVCLERVWEICRAAAVERHGQPWHESPEGTWQPTRACVLGMGKLGGQELNYSSDVDVLLVYQEEGAVFREEPGPGKAAQPVMANHPFFNRLAEQFVTELTRVTAQGSLFRVDLRLRPEGESGPLCRSLGSYENYYGQWGQTWERMMLIKARPVAGDTLVAGEFLEMAQPFRYPRFVSQSALEEIGQMKERMENEVIRSDEIHRNVKLGLGGIREIEFIVQSQQVLKAGQQPFLQGANTLVSLAKLAQYDMLPWEDSRKLRDAYCFLREVEHRLQMEEGLQTHTLPAEGPARTRLAHLMNLGAAGEFDEALGKHTRTVREIFDRTIRPPKVRAEASEMPHNFSGGEARAFLAERGFRDPDKAARSLREFVEGPGYVHVSPRTVEVARRLLRRLFEVCPTAGNLARLGAGAGAASELTGGATDGEGPAAPPPAGAEAAVVLSDPDRVVTRLDSFVAAYKARTVLFDFWDGNPRIFQLMLLLFDRSEFLAELAIRSPDMVDALVISGRLRRRKSAEETLGELRHGLGDEDQHAWLRRYHHSELMRIGLRDILGVAGPEQYLTELSALADACLQYAVEVVMKRHRRKTPPFSLIGLGKLGGMEIDYGSDLDVVFVTEGPVAELPKLQRLALEVVDLISKRTEEGLVFHTDTRLRPDGEKGLVANTLEAFEHYYRQRAALWEIQTLTRTRPVAGDSAVGEKFQRMAARMADFSKANSAPGPGDEGGPPACFSPDWKRQIFGMRQRIEKERTPPGKDRLSIKTGAGGVVDAEFIAQVLCLENGWREANTLRALERAHEAGKLPGAAGLIQSYRQLRRVEGILRRWSFEGETVLPDEEEAYRRVSLRCGFETPEKFGAALGEWRKTIRGAFLEVFDATG
jgi:glutamate-ammonia-ligase adenylyltransferase